MECCGLQFKGEVKRSWHNNCIEEVKRLELVSKCDCVDCLKKYERIGSELSDICLEYIEDGKEYKIAEFEDGLWLREVRFKFVEENVSSSSIKCFGYSDPEGLLKVGRKYGGKKEVHAMHTNIYLERFPDKVFNSVWFEEV